MRKISLYRARAVIRPQYGWAVWIQYGGLNQKPFKSPGIKVRLTAFCTLDRSSMGTILFFLFK